MTTDADTERLTEPEIEEIIKHCNEQSAGHDAVVFLPIARALRQLHQDTWDYASACAYLDRAVPVFGAEDNPARIRTATDLVVKLRKGVEDYQERIIHIDVAQK